MALTPTDLSRRLSTVLSSFSSTVESNAAKWAKAVVEWAQERLLPRDEVSTSPGANLVPRASSKGKIAPDWIDVDWGGVGGGGGGGGGPHAATHASNGSDPVTLAQSQITGLTTALASKADSTDARFPTNSQKDALAGTGTPGSTNKFVTQDTLSAGLASKLSATIASTAPSSGVIPVAGANGNLDVGFIPYATRIPRKWPIDANDVHVWPCEDLDAAATIADIGSSPCPIPTNSTVFPGAQGLFGRGLACSGNGGAGTGTANTGIPSTTAASISLWLFMTGTGGPYSHFFGKQYYNSWTSPWVGGLALQVMGNSTSSSYLLQGSVTTTTGGLQTFQSRIAASGMPGNRWCHLGVTFDGSVIRIYLNGQVHVTGNVNGSVIDWGTGGWYIGKPYGFSSEGFIGWICDIRVANGVRDATWFQNVWDAGRVG